MLSSTSGGHNRYKSIQPKSLSKLDIIEKTIFDASNHPNFLTPIIENKLQ